MGNAPQLSWVCIREKKKKVCIKADIFSIVREAFTIPDMHYMFVKMMIDSQVSNQTDLKCLK